MAKKAEKAVPPAKAPAFTREQILRSDRWRTRRDALTFLLEEGKRYTHEETGDMLERYMKGQVK